MTDPPPSSSRRDLLVVLSWAALLRVVNLYSFFTNSPLADSLVSDARVFDQWALRISQGDWLGESGLFVLPPLYAYLIGAVYTVIGHTPSVVYILQSVLGVFSAGLIHRLVSIRFGRRPALAAALIYGSIGTLLFYETALIGTTIATLLIILFLTLGDHWLRTGNRRILGGSGLCLGLLGLLRPNTLAIAPVFFLWTLYQSKGLRSPETWRRRWPLVLGVAVPLVISLLRNGLVAGIWTPLPAHGGINFYMGNHPGAPGWFQPPPGMRADITPDAPQGNLVGPRKLAEADLGRALSDQEVSSYWFRRGFAFMATQPVEATRVLLRKTHLFLSAHEQRLNYSYEFHRRYSPPLRLPFGQLWFVYPLALVGAVWAVRKKLPVGDWLLFFAALAASVLAFHVSSRYRMPAVPILACFAGLGLTAPLAAFERGRFVAAAPLGAAIIVAIVGYYSERATWAIDESAEPFNLGTSSLYDGDYDAAVAWFESSRDAGGQFPTLFYNLGYAYTEVGNTSEAEEAYRRAIDLAPDMAEAHTNLGNILFKSDRFEEAGESYKRALAVNPNAHNARAALGWVEYVFRRSSAARSHWERVLQAVPGHLSAATGMQRLAERP